MRREGSRFHKRALRLLGATALGCLAVPAALPVTIAAAQAVDGLTADLPDDAQLLLEADTLVYDRDNDTISAVGSVRIDYGGNRLVAQRITYDRRTGRLIASGNVEMVDAQGTRINAQEIDVTDNFRDGFLNAMQVETVDETYFGAESGERRDGNVTTFNNGVYTACKPCEEEPDKAPIWRIKAQKIIWNGEAKTVRFKNARFELFGFPIAGLPYFEIADHTVKRKTGFLFPSIHQSKELGVGVRVPFYIALNPSYDITLHGTYYGKQGFLGEAEWRQRLERGQYNLKIAGISQRQPSAFLPGFVDAQNIRRGMFATKGDFTINPRWTFGWDILIQSDKNFSYTYAIDGYDEFVHRSEIYLTGLDDRNFFDLRFMRFQVQESTPDSVAGTINDTQPWVLPSLDYTKTFDEPVAGGELSLDVNLQGIYRKTELFSATVPAERGISGTNGRLTAEVEWKRTFVTDGGLLITPLLHARADAIHSNPTATGIANIATVAGATGAGTDFRSSYFRSMATAGLEIRYPILFATENSSHVIEPIAQLFARPNEGNAWRLGIPNEDAQSFVFDASTLFERDKYSGYDRIEGGVRANLGFRYSGTFGDGWSADALVGQSFHLAGTNSFATPDLVHAGANSGLETSTSDYVAMAAIQTPFGLSGSVSGRFDEKTLDLRRLDTKAAASFGPATLNARYTFIQAQPLYGLATDRHEVYGGATLKFADNWRAFGSATYDLQSRTLVSDSIGLGYDDECFSYSLTMSHSRSILGTTPTTRSFSFHIALRTLGEFGSSSGDFGSQ